MVAEQVGGIAETPGTRSVWHRLALGPWPLCAALFLVCLFLFTRNNDFHHACHPDELGKARQILEGEHNFKHPLLMLTTTELAMVVFAVERTPQAVLRVGRCVSAFYAALAVAVLALTAFRLRGWAGAACVGVMCATTPSILHLAHFMKEDTILLGALSLVLLALTEDWKRRSPWSAAFVGATCGLAASSKYIGFVALAAAIPLVLIRRSRPGRRARLKRLALLTGLFCAVFLVANYHMMGDLAGSLAGVSYEVGHVKIGGTEFVLQRPYMKYVNYFGSLPVMFFVAVAFHGLYMLITARRRSGPEWLITLFPVAYLGVLLSSTLTSKRYLLPVETGLAVLAGLAVCEFVSLIAPWARRLNPAITVILIVACLIVVARGQVPQWWRSHESFEVDSRRELIRWIVESLPAVQLAQDSRVGLPGASKIVPPPPEWGARPDVLSARYAADLGTLAELRAAGVQYVVVTRTRYRNLFREDYDPSAGQTEEARRRKRFYETLFTEGRRVWEAPPGFNNYLQPGLRVYAIQPQDQPPRPSTE